ncbi:MAG: 30S ribosomal protein S7 [Candidatus Pacebacteria bacterium RIFOXYB1_FULL_39_46]|nr:MAG: 30S ribosomal protein S7 [Candidatus Pacebacteria bacterium RIFOXYB1_FULL_39_46]OGJ38999.1 MAG: 30S ribosomal protein S7 [Candidatus Pacebacteria bacterium RIFOXYA1_FULL_38_18]OGJ39970.1 MAG: 30S ribosomal protein S7 [Candidatus Pacebacteria bacterium RIFOXYD1_FULL_39_27]OGJ40768.1 MAG: 30S ribosomal protein S7 [Candidatus Pacebacteria bacterium RIFOXYC1_FULL_39_21]
MRTKQAKVRETTPDSKHGSVVVAKLINQSMLSGKKTVAQKHVYQALDLVAKKTGKKPIEILEETLRNIAPQMEVRSRRVGGASYQVPMPVRSRRGTSLALRWLVAEANKRSNAQYHTYAEKLAAEMLDALANTGGAIDKKMTSHRMAEANKAFSHFRW